MPPGAVAAEETCRAEASRSATSDLASLKPATPEPSTTTPDQGQHADGDHLRHGVVALNQIRIDPVDLLLRGALAGKALGPVDKTE